MTCLRLRVRIRDVPLEDTLMCVRIRAGLHMLLAHLHLCGPRRTHPEMLVVCWIVSVGKTVLHLELACGYKCTASQKTVVAASIEELGEKKL